MDKYEYKLKTEQMLELMEDGAFNKAAEIADSVDWKRVRNTKMLTDVSDIYEKNGDYQKSYDVLNIAYHRAEGSRKIIYRLCTLALKTKNVDEAIDYYDDFQQIAPKDPNKFILRYQILRAQKAPLEQQIEALEEFKKAEYIEEWAYELAKRYQEAGMTAECLEECDDLILWFNEGKYVYQAMELKMQYKPLTPSQQAKYDNRFARMSNETMEMPNVVEYKNEKDAAANAESVDVVPAEAKGTSEQTVGESARETEKRETKGRKIGSTMKLDEALKSLLNLGMGEEDKVKDSSSEPVSTDVIFEEDKFKDAIEEIEAVADLDLIDEISSQKGLRELKVDSDLEELLPDPLPDEEKTLEELYADAGAPLEELDMDTRQMGTSVGGDTKVLDKETLQTIAALDKEGSEAHADVVMDEEKHEEVIAELDEEAREIIAELDEEARKTIEELDAEEVQASEVYTAESIKPAPVEHKNQVEGQMNLLDLMADLDVGPEASGEAQVIADASEISLETDVKETEDIEIPEEREASAEESTEKSKAAEPILPLDIQRMIDEIEGVVSVEEPDEKAEKETLEQQNMPEQEEEPRENMGEIADQLRVDESSEWFEDYDDVLDEEEYAEEPPIETEEPDEEEFTGDIEISFGGEDEEAEEAYEEEEEFGEIREEDAAGERFTIEYEEESEFGYEEEYPDAEPQYAGEAENEKASRGEAEPVDHAVPEAEEPEYGETAYGEPESEYIIEPVYEEAVYEEEPEYTEEYEEEEPEYTDAVYEEEPEYAEEYEEGEPEYEDTVYEEDPEYEDGGSEYGNGGYAEEEYAGEYDDESVYEEEYEETQYEEEPEYGEYEYGEDLEDAGEYEEEEYEDGYEYEEEYYAEEEYEEESEYEEYDAVSVEENLEHEFRPQKASRRHHDEREIPDEEEEMDILSATTPLSRKETAKLIATGKTSPLPVDEISDALSISDTGFIVHGRYDLRTQSGIGTRAGLTEEQKKLFSYFVPVRGMSEQLVDVLEQDKNCTNRRGTSITGNLLIIGNKGNGKTVLAVDVVKAIQRQRNIRQGRVAIVTGDSLNKKKVSDIFSKLYGGALIIEKAGKMNEKTVARVNKAMERDTGELLIVLEDQRKPLDRILTSNREFRRKFTSRLEVPILINDELVTFGQTYAQENGYQIDEMGILALYSRIDMLQREDHAVTIAEVKEVMDEAMEHSQKASAKKLVKRVLGKNRDDSDRIILTEKDFI